MRRLSFNVNKRAQKWDTVGKPTLQQSVVYGAEVADHTLIETDDAFHDDTTNFLNEIK